jgi:fatty acid synthase
MHGKLYSEFPVTFENIEMHTATIMEREVITEFRIMIHPSSGDFKVLTEDTVNVTGSIMHTENVKLFEKNKTEISNESVTLLSDDLYKEFRLRGYNFHGEFCSIAEFNIDGSHGKLKWNGNWIPFLDGLVQMFFPQESRRCFLPVAIQKFVIDPKLHMEIVDNLDSEIKVIEAFRHLEKLRCGGVEVCEIVGFSSNNRKSPGRNWIGTYKFISSLPAPVMSLEHSAYICVDLASDSLDLEIFKIIEIDYNDDRGPLISSLAIALLDRPRVNAVEYIFQTTRKLELDVDGVTVVDQSLSHYSDCCIIIRSNCLNDPEFLDSASKSLHDKGCIVSREAIEFNSTTIRDLPPDFQLLAVIPTTENETLVILQCVKKEIEIPQNILKITNSEYETYEWLDKLKELTEMGPVIVYSQNEQYSGILGFVNCIRRELGSNNITCVFIDDPEAPEFDVKHPFYSKQLKLGLSMNVYRNGKWGAYMHLPLTIDATPQPHSDYILANILTPGSFSAIKWFEGPSNFDKTNEEIVSVKYAALNFHDIMVASGKLPLENGQTPIDLESPIGLEYAGVKGNGERVMGIIDGGAFTTYINPNQSMNLKCPDDWSLEEAATVPIVYLTVYTAFFHFVQIEKGKTVLIHAGSGGVGLAAIRVAFAYGLEVFTTVSTEEKNKFLLKEFPQLKKENIGNSRDTSFVDMIMENTNGKGVDYVLNSLIEEKLQASLRCLTWGGKFIEIGKYDMMRNSKLGMKFFTSQRSFYMCAVDDLLRTESHRMKVSGIILKSHLTQHLIL